MRIDDDRMVDADGNLVAIRYPRLATARIAAMLNGRVLDGGLGFGAIRRAVMRLQRARSIESVEISQDVIDTESPLEVPPPDGMGASITHADVEDRLAASAGDDWDSCVLDLDPSPKCDKPSFRAALRQAFPNLGARVVVVSERLDIALPGFNRGVVYREDLGSWSVYVHVFDRYQPSAGIGVRNPFGNVYVPGYGWRTV